MLATPYSVEGKRGDDWVQLALFASRKLAKAFEADVPAVDAGYSELRLCLVLGGKHCVLPGQAGPITMPYSV